MVRIKERYLLVNILYPPHGPDKQKSDVPDLLLIRQPTSDRLKAQDLIRDVKAMVTQLFGDYGAGAVTGNLSGMYDVFCYGNTHD